MHDAEANFGCGSLASALGWNKPVTLESPSLRKVMLVYELTRTFNGPIYAEVINHYWQRLREVTADEAIAVHVGARFNPLQDPHSELYVMSRTIGEGITRAFEFFNSLNRHSQYSSYAQPGCLVLTVSYPRHLGLLPFDVEWRLSLISHAIKWFTQELDPDGIRAVSFRASRPAYDRELIRVLGCPVQFDQPVDAVMVDASVLEVPVWGSEAIRLKFSKLVSAVIAETKHASPRLSERVANITKMGLQQGHSGIKWLAPQFGMSPRTLQRRLAEEGMYYFEILDQTRMLLCLQLLSASGMNMLSMAKRLGYSSESNFLHAFRRWFGTTPGLYRLMVGGRDSSTLSSRRPEVQLQLLMTGARNSSTLPSQLQTETEAEASVLHGASLNSEREPGQ